MVGDSNRKLSTLYDVLWPVLKIDRRATYVIDYKGIIRGAFVYELQITKHLEEVFEILNQIETGRKRENP